MIRMFTTVSLLTLMLVGLLAGSTLLTLHTYYRLSQETLVAELTFDRVAPQLYRATLLSGDFCQPQTYLLKGDQWRLDARFLKWKPWANLLGLDSRYRLERLEGRFADIQQHNRTPPLAYELEPQTPLSFTEPLAQTLLAVMADAVYGSSTYQGLDSGYRYQVFKTQSGLITRIRPRTLERAGDGSWVIEINHGCGS